MAYIKNNSAAFLVGTSLDDTLDSSQSWDQQLYGGLGNDTYLINGGSGDIVVERPGEGTDTIILVDFGSSFLSQALPAEVENLSVQAGLNPSDFGITGNGLNNVIATAGGDDTLDGGAGNDTLAGGAGNDTYYVDAAADVVTEAANGGWDIVYSSVSYTLPANAEVLVLTGSAAINATGSAGNDIIVGNAGANAINGLAGNDILQGFGGNDVLTGDVGDDSLDGGAGNDTMTGGAGNDVYYVDSSGDVVTEVAGGGQDRVYLGDAVLNYVLSANVEDLYLAGEGNTAMSGKTGSGNALDNFILGTDYDDTLVGDAGNDTLDGGDGLDVMRGGLGNDIFVVTNGGDQAIENLNEGTDTVYSYVDYALGANVENLVLTGTNDASGWGNALNNVLTGNDGSNWLWGGAGNDVFVGKGGFDEFWGGAGNDTYYYDGVDVVHEQFSQGVDTLISTVDVTALFLNVENLTLNGAAVKGYGNALDNVITGNNADNDLSGGGGNDTLIGGLGNDIYRIDNGDTVTEAAGAGTDTVFFGGSGTHILAANVENLQLTPGAGNINGTGNTGDNVLTGNSGDNTLDGGAGNDTLYGGAGNDTLIGGIGNDILNGQSGGDVMKGGAGDDTYYVTGLNDRADESTASAGGGIDTIISNLRLTDLTNATLFLKSAGASGTDVIENITLDFSAVDAIGNSLANVIRGNAGVNSLTGGDGNDTYYVDLRDKVVEAGTAGAGVDTVVVDVDAGQSPYTGTPIYLDLNTTYANVENMTLLGTGNYAIRGTAGNNVLIGNAGINWFSAGLGNDTMSGGAGDDVYQVDNIGDIVNENANQGLDLVLSRVTYTLGANVENLRLTGPGNLNGTGNALDNQIEGNGGNNLLTGNDGNDRLYGRGGNDTLNGGNGNDVLDGEEGADNMTGGAGNDEYWVDNAGDAITELAGQGTDKVVFRGNASYTTFTLGAAQSIEVLQAVAGGSNLNLTGNISDNTLIGNAGNNTLVGGGGNDVFDGGAGGNDNMSGGAGNDVFNFTAANSLDSGDILAGSTGTDVLNATFHNLTTTLANIGGIETFNFSMGGAGSSTINFASTVTGLTAVNLGGNQGFITTGLGTAGGANVPVFTLNNFGGGAVVLGLTDNSGGTDAVTVNLNSSAALIDTSGVETVNLNVAGTPPGGTNSVTASFAGATEINVSGAGSLSLYDLDQAVLTPGTQHLALTGYTGSLNLSLLSAAGGSDSVTLEVHDSQAVVNAWGIEAFVVDSGLGNAASNIRLEGTDATTVVAKGDSELVLSFDGNALDATAFTGDYLRAYSFSGSGSSFQAGKAGVSTHFIGSTGNDAFDFAMDGPTASIDNTDYVNGGAGYDSVTARIDGLAAATTGRLRFENVEAIGLVNNAVASIDGVWMGNGTGAGTQVTLSGSGGVAGNGEINSVTGISSGFESVFHNLGRDLSASAYVGDVIALSANTGAAHGYTAGSGNFYFFGSSAFGIHDTFNFAADYNNGDFVEGFDIDNSGGGDVLNATLGGLNATTGALRIQGVETVNFELDGTNVVNAAGIDHAYTININDLGGAAATGLTLYGLDATGVSVYVNDFLTASVDITGGDGNDLIVGGGVNDVLSGGLGNDSLEGNNGADTLNGGSGNDTLSGSGGADTLNGDDGDDRLAGGQGNDALDGGNGYDTIDYQNEGGMAGISANLASGSVTDTWGNVDTLVLGSIERVIGTNAPAMIVGPDTFLYSDLLIGSLNSTHHGLAADSYESYEGMGGNDYINGGGSGAWGYWDVATYVSTVGGVYGYLGQYGSAPATITVNGHSINFGTVQDGFGGVDTLSEIDSIRGGSFDDILVGGSTSRNITGTIFESFIGGEGNDFIAGNGNAAQTGAVNTGDFDRVDYTYDPRSVYVNLGAGTARDGWGDTDTLRDINLVRGSNYSDTLVGGVAANDGFEAFEGQRGDDIIDGGTGYDRADYRSATAGVTVDLGAGTAQDGLGGQDSLFNIEAVLGSDFNDTFIGGAGNDNFTGMAGNDSMNGGAGIDRADYRNEFDDNADGIGVSVNLALGTATDGWGNTDTLIGIENVRGTIYDDTIVGDANANFFDSQYGSDTLTGGGGADVFYFSTAPLSWTGTGVPVPASDNMDTITDFATGVDKLQFDNGAGGPFTGLGADGAFVAGDARFYIGGSAHDADDRLIYDSVGGILYYDADGTGATAAVQVAVLSGQPTLAATDIMVV